MRLTSSTWILSAVALVATAGCTDTGGTAASGGTGGASGQGGAGGLDPALVEQGKDIFRNDTFGDEALWTDMLELHTVIAAAVDPLTALAVGLKVDASALPEGILDAVDLEDPATTVALLELDAVVGVKGKVEEIEGVDVLTSVGITCALCHSTVDDSLIPGVGNRLDGWPNRDLDPGLILSLSPGASRPRGPGRAHLLGSRHV